MLTTVHGLESVSSDTGSNVAFVVSKKKKIIENVDIFVSQQDGNKNISSQIRYDSVHND